MPSLSRQQQSTPTAAGTANPTTVAQNQIQQRHFVDAMLLEADRAVNRKLQISNLFYIFTLKMQIVVRNAGNYVSF